MTSRRPDGRRTDRAGRVGGASRRVNAFDLREGVHDAFADSLRTCRSISSSKLFCNSRGRPMRRGFRMISTPASVHDGRAGQRSR